MMAFAAALPAIRKRTDADLARPGLPREKVLAAVVRLLETTLIRVGNEEYARTNKSFGLTTMRDRHVRVGGKSVRFEFRGKSGVKHEIDLADPRLARIVGRCRDLPGQELFQYLDEEGRPRTIDSADVNEYIREAAGREFTAKDFRTWAGTVLASLRTPRVRGVRLGGAGQEEHRPRHRERRRAAGQHPLGLPEVLRPPRGDRGLPRRLDARDPQAAGRAGAGRGAARPPPRGGRRRRAAPAAAEAGVGAAALIGAASLGPVAAYNIAARRPRESPGPVSPEGERNP